LLNVRFSLSRKGRGRSGDASESVLELKAARAFKLGPLPAAPFRRNAFQPRGKNMVITAAHITPLVALVAGILILVMPRLLNFIVAIYLIIVGVMGLNAINHFIH